MIRRGFSNIYVLATFFDIIEYLLILAQIYFCIPEIERTFQTGFGVQNHLLNLCSRVVNLQRLFCSQKEKCPSPFLRFFFVVSTFNL